jgi:hypothetical protein
VGDVGAAVEHQATILVVEDTLQHGHRREYMREPEQINVYGRGPVLTVRAIGRTTPRVAA